MKSRVPADQEVMLNDSPHTVSPHQEHHSTWTVAPGGLGPGKRDNMQSDVWTRLQASYTEISRILSFGTVNWTKSTRILTAAGAVHQGRVEAKTQSAQSEHEASNLRVLGLSPKLGDTCCMNNKNPELDIRVQPENRKSKAGH